MTTILIKADQITKNTILGGNIDVSKYLPAIKNYQKTRLVELLGKQLYKKICDDFENDSLTGLYLEMYDDFIQDMVINGGAENYLTFGAYMVSNNGITKMKSDNADAIKKEEVDFMVQSARKLTEHYERQFLKWIESNPVPEYVVSTRCKSNYINIGGWVIRK
jgi:hypothetical protein